MVDASRARPNTMVTSVDDDARETVTTLVEEEVAVSKHVVPTRRIQISRLTRQHEQLVDELLTREHVEIERIPIGKPVDVMPSVREEQDSIVIPVVDEILTIERQLILREEVRIRRVKSTERYQERVILHTQEAVIRRWPVDAITAPADTAEDSPSDHKEEP